MSQLFIGALGPPADSVPTSLSFGLTVHIVGGSIDADTIFEVHDKGRTLYLKNTRSTVSLEGWTVAPRIYEAEDATISNARVINNTFSSGKKYVEAKGNGNDTTYVQWNVSVPSAGAYLISLRYAHRSSPRPLSVSDSIIEMHVLFSSSTLRSYLDLTSSLGLREHTGSESLPCQPKRLNPIVPCW